MKIIKLIAKRADTDEKGSLKETLCKLTSFEEVRWTHGHVHVCL